MWVNVTILSSFKHLILGCMSRMCFSLAHMGIRTWGLAKAPALVGISGSGEALPPSGANFGFKSVYSYQYLSM